MIWYQLRLAENQDPADQSTTSQPHLPVIRLSSKKHRGRQYGVRVLSIESAYGHWKSLQGETAVVIREPLRSYSLILPGKCRGGVSEDGVNER